MGEVTKLPNRNTSKEALASQRYVRVTNEDAHGFVEFQFSIGDPNLYLEMTLPQTAFEEFCATQNAQMLTPDQARAVDATELKWRYGRDVDDESLS